MFVLYCESEQEGHQKYIFKADHKVEEEEFDEFVKEEHPDEYEFDESDLWDDDSEYWDDDEDYDEDEDDCDWEDEGYNFLNIVKQVEVADDDPILDEAELIEDVYR